MPYPHRLASALSLTAAVVALSAAPASGFTTYTDRAAFDAAATAGGGTLLTQDFNSVTEDRSFQLADGPQSLGDLTFAETGPATAGAVNGNPNRFDVSPYESVVFNIDNTPIAYLAANADDNPANVYGVDLTFASPASAFGGDFGDFVSTTGPSESFRLTLLGAAAQSFLLPVPASTSTNFFGIVGDPGETFTGIAFSADAVVPSSRAVAGLDNAAYVLVPEPATAAAALLGLSLLPRRSRGRAAR